MDLSDKWMFKTGLQRHVKIAMDKAIAHVERNPHLDLADVLKADVKMETQRFITQERLKEQSFGGYNPGGMAMPNRNIVGDYRYNYQGQELDKETGKIAFQLRLYDPRINRWTTTDPYRQYHSPYVSMGNNWVSQTDPDGGKADDWYKDSDGNYVFDSRVNSQADLATYGLDGTYVGDTFSDFNAGQIGDASGNLFSMNGSLITSFLDGIEISNITYFDIYRDTQTSNSTTSTFTFGDVTGYALERPGPDTTTPNMRLRIPAGIYNVSLHNGTSYKNVLKLSNNQVAASRAILIHNGNYPKNTDGCILVGCSRSKDFVGSSVKKLNKIRAAFKDIDIKNIRVRVHNNFPHRGIPFLD